MKKIALDIRSVDGQVTKGNEWAVELTKHIGKICEKHGKGFIFAPWGGSNTSCKSFFATSHTDPMMFGAGIAMMMSNYLKNNPDVESREDKIKWVNAAAQTVIDLLDEEEDGE